MRTGDSTIRHLSKLGLSGREIADRIGLPTDHVESVMRAGGELDGSRLMTKFERRFWSKVHKTTNCWIWLGCRVAGYGRIRVGQRLIGAHQISWRLYNGEVPEGLVVCHDCPDGDNPACVNPAHMYLASQTENLRDRSRKMNSGVLKWQTEVLPPDETPVPAVVRVPLGESSKNAKLTEADVRVIRHRYRKGETTYAELAREFGVSGSTIASIVKRTGWKHIG